MRWTLSAAAVLVALLASAGAAEARDYYGAIAYSPSTGAYGYSYDHVSRANAETAALAACSEHAGDCQVPVWFRNACAALAVGNGGSWGTGWGSSRRLAERFARRTCGEHASNCAVIRWVCTTR
jgi:Domain of unknown function (DUF4189)